MKSLAITRSNLPVQGVRLLMEKSANIPDAIHLEVGEPNINTPIHIREAAENAMRDEFTHYTPNAGLTSLREAIVKDLKQRYDIDANAKQTAVTAGAVNALMISLLAIVDPDEEVLIPDPAWPNYELMLRMQGSIARKYTLDADRGFLPDLSELESLVNSKTKAILINTPGNPTGAVFHETKIKELLDFATRHDLYLISDEVYDGIVFEEKHISPKTFDKEERVISIFSFSKNYAMTGWRVGYAVASEKIISTMTKIIEPVISCAPAFAQKAAENALNTPDDFLISMANGYRERRDKAFDILTKAKIKAYKPKGAFYMLIDISDAGLPSDEFAFALLEEEKVSVGPGSTFGETTKDMIRISLATEELDLLEGVSRICNFILRCKEKVTSK
ncbi:aminotransferase class I/II-fold pyridoxal phosphate-dependent enzyme [bacterium LRH843]|nr:aminotransferase class I/II-fold pyridoxal phosphate-dependent enzyme [bacterium LRH843]